MTNKQLSMIKNTKFVSECWTIYKLAILQNHADYNKWLINHLNNLTMTKNYWCQFGLDGERQNFQMVYGDLLDIEEFNIYEIKQGTVPCFVGVKQRPVPSYILTIKSNLQQSQIREPVIS